MIHYYADMIDKIDLIATVFAGIIDFMLKLIMSIYKISIEELPNGSIWNHIDRN